MASAVASRREEILRRLDERVRQGRAILGAGCSAGIVARSADRAGADLIIVYSTGKSRLLGLPTWRLGNSNAVTLEMFHEIDNVVSPEAAVIGGIEACDPTNLNIERMVRRFLERGFSGLINFPTVGTMPDLRLRGEQVGLGFDREVEAIRIAHDMGAFTMAYVTTPDDAEAMTRAGVDVLVPHAGPTSGGEQGFVPKSSWDQTLAEAEAMIVAGRAIRPGLVCLLHGGALSSPDDVRGALAKTTADGFVGASSVERIPIERAITDVVKAFRDIKIDRDGSEQPRGH